MMEHKVFDSIIGYKEVQLCPKRKNLNTVCRKKTK